MTAAERPARGASARRRPGRTGTATRGRDSQVKTHAQAVRPSLARPARAADPSQSMTEAQLQAAVTDLCAFLGVWVYHTHDSRRSNPGWPDLVLLGPEAMLLRELKTARGRLSVHQMNWGARLQRAGQDWAVWRPEDLLSGRILAELRETL